MNDRVRFCEKVRMISAIFGYYDSSRLDGEDRQECRGVLTEG